jgi:hypothetical protein
MLGREAGFNAIVSKNVILISNKNVSFCTYVLSTNRP